MGNGGVYGVTEYPYQTDPVESSTYTPHLLPMFQQQPPFHNMNNPDHLEDASVLLSMAYPGGFPNNGDGSSTQAQQAVPDVPDWAGGQTINMMMEASDQAQNQANVERDRSGSAQSQLITPVPVGDDTLSEAMGNFLGAMIWPGVNKDGNTPGEGALNWVSTMCNSYCGWAERIDKLAQSTVTFPSVFVVLAVCFRHIRSSQRQYQRGQRRRE